MSWTKSPSTGTPYGLARVLGAWGVPRSTYYWQRTRRHNPLEARKRGPKTAFSDKELTEQLRQEIAAAPFTGEGHRKFWARLRFAGVRTSKARVLRLMRDALLLDVSRGPWKKNGTLYSVIRVSYQAATSACSRTSLRRW